MSDIANIAPSTTQVAKIARCRCGFDELSFGIELPTAVAAPDVTRSTTLRFDIQDPAA
jgi:hypothetical protein